MRQLDVTRTALALSAATAQTVLLVTMPTAGQGHDEGLAALVGSHFGHGPWVPLAATGSLTLIGETIDDIDDMRSFMRDLRGILPGKPRSQITATLFSQGAVADHVAGLAAPWPLGIEPEIGRWRQSVAARAA